MKVVIESPLNSRTQTGIEKNKRFVEWCLRAVWIVDGLHGLASHLVCPHFLDDAVQGERAAGIGWSWFWQGDPHWFFRDLGDSHGMKLSKERCLKENIPVDFLRLATYHPESWEAFLHGERAPHTQGF